jgi:transposase
MGAEDVELAEDGSPLGTLKVDGKVYPKDATGGLAKIADTELKRSVSVDATDEDDADDALIESYEGFSDEELRKKALQLYVVDGKVASEVARELKVPERTVLLWAYKGKWNKAAARELAVKAEEEARALTRFRLKHREALLQKQIDDASVVQDKVMEKVRRDEISLKSASESLALVAKVQNQAMGVADSGAIATTESEGGGKGKGGEATKVLVAVFQGNAAGIPTLGKRGGTVDV